METRLTLPALLLLALPAQGGEITLEGTYERRTDAYSRQVLGDAVCFFPSERFERLVPRQAGDERRVWFCFSNRADAAKALAIPPRARACGARGTATIAISGYAVSKGGGESVDTARLERVLEKSAPRPIPCNE